MFRERKVEIKKGSEGEREKKIERERERNTDVRNIH